MNMNNADMPAMPLTGDAYTDINGTANCQGSIQDGMGLTKREHFAGLIMASLAGPNRYMGLSAESAVQWADALLTELNKGE
jgi:hypothetical protein